MGVFVGLFGGGCGGVTAEGDDGAAGRHPGGPTMTGSDAASDGAAGAAPDGGNVPSGGASGAAGAGPSAIDGSSDAASANDTASAAAEAGADVPVDAPAASCVPAASGTRFVDHAMGTDDAAHGGGTGRCAYKTLTYALAHAPDDVALLAQDTYQGGVAGEALPFLLTGHQTLTCNGAQLQNETTMGTYAGIVQFAGTHNAVTGCNFNGGDQGGYCLIVNASAADLTKPHVVTQSTFTKCDNVTLVVPAGFDGVTISKNTFTLNFASIYLAGAHTNISVVDNTFVGNSKDVMCDDAAPGVTGSGNVRGGGAIACSVCGGCPF
jgi:parallel beta-helix repeat protein